MTDSKPYHADERFITTSLLSVEKESKRQRMKESVKETVLRDNDKQVLMIISEDLSFVSTYIYWVLWKVLVR